MLNAISHSTSEVHNEHFLVETSAGIQFYMDAWDEQETSTNTKQQESSQCQAMD